MAMTLATVASFAIVLAFASSAVAMPTAGETVISSDVLVAEYDAEEPLNATSPMVACSPQSEFYAFRGERRFSNCYNHRMGARPQVQLRFRSYNSDAYFAIIKVCASGSSTNCVESFNSKYSGSGGEKTVLHTVSDRGYSDPVVRIYYKCDNWIENCQIDMTSAALVD
eukprot:COSAG05_NODE_511_length_9092_cov_6.078839_7_plen_168_part_00